MKLVYAYFVLDILHTGHLLQMKNAKAIAGKDGRLVVGILTDSATMEKKPKPILPFKERLEVAKSIKYVDLVVSQETYSPIPNIRMIKPDILIESGSHNKEDIKKVDGVMKSMGGKVIVLPYYPEISSTRIKRRIQNE